MAGWWLARAQANLGVGVFLYRAGRNRRDEIPIPRIIRRTFSSSSTWIEISHDLYKWVMQNRDRVHLLHLHSVFTPLNTQLARACRKAHLPYILTPHGGYDRNIFDRGWIKKKLYFNLFERRLLHGARGIHCVAAPEVNDIRRLGHLIYLICLSCSPCIAILNAESSGSAGGMSTTKDSIGSSGSGAF